jgi:DNA-binding transcriptional ArsR family regulator
MRTFFHPKREDISLPAILYALSDPLRLKIVAELASVDEAISASDFSTGKGIAKSTLSHHFKVLRESGVTHTVPQGTRFFISLRREDLQARFPGLLDAILHAYHTTMATEE